MVISSGPTATPLHQPGIPKKLLVIASGPLGSNSRASQTPLGAAYHPIVEVMGPANPAQWDEEILRPFARSSFFGKRVMRSCRRSIVKTLDRGKVTR